jgi:uncharacterized tellurite resistance protein B-like protein
MTTTIADEDGCLRRVLVMMMMSDGDLDPDELTALRRAYADVTGRPGTEAELREEARTVVEQKLTPGSCAGLGDGLDEAGKLRVLDAVFSVAAADGFVVQEEDAMLGLIARDLGLPSATYEAAIRRFLQERRLPRH